MEFVLQGIREYIKRFGVLLLLLVVLSASIIFAYPKLFLAVPPAPLTHIRLNQPSWPGFMIAPLAEELGYMREEGIKIGYKEYPDKSVLDEVDIEPYDVRGMLAVDLVEEARRIRPLGKIVIITDRSIGGDALLVYPGAPSIQSSEKKTITGDDSYPFFFPYVIDLLKGDMNSFVSDVSITQEEVVDKITTGKVNYAMTYEPYLSLAISKGAVKVFSSKDASGVVTDTLIFSNHIIEQHPQLVQGFARAYMRAYNYWKANPKEAYRMVRKVFNRSPEEFAAQMKEVEMLGLSENNASMFSGIGLRSIYGNIRAVQVYENRKGPVIDVNVDALVYPDPIRTLFQRLSEI